MGALIFGFDVFFFLLCGTLLISTSYQSYGTPLSTSEVINSSFDSSLGFGEVKPGGAIDGGSVPEENGLEARREYGEDKKIDNGRKTKDIYHTTNRSILKNTE